jgi:membrane protease YdiL (CAAX protease family)
MKKSQKPGVDINTLTNQYSSHNSNSFDAIPPVKIIKAVAPTPVRKNVNRNVTTNGNQCQESELASYKGSFKGGAGTVLLLHAVLSVILQVTWISLPDKTFGVIKNGMIGYVSAALLMQGICILVPALFVIFWFNIPAKLSVGISKGFGGGLIMSATMGIPAAVVFVGLNNGFVYLLSRLGFVLPPSSLPNSSVGQGPSTFVLVMLIGVLLPGIIEELMFRGLILGSMQSQGGRYSAIFFSALAFAIFHADPLFILAPFLAGLLLGFIRTKTGNIYSTILTHSVMNLTIILMAPLLPKITYEYVSTMTSNSVIYASLLSACIASVALIPMIFTLSTICDSTRKQSEKYVLFPFDVKFVLAMLILTATLLFVYFSGI